MSDKGSYDKHTTQARRYARTHTRITERLQNVNQVNVSCMQWNYFHKETSYKLQSDIHMYIELLWRQAGMISL